MIYLFWAFSAVWGGIFLYLSLLGRRSRALADEIETLRGRPQSTSASAAPRAGARTGRS